MEVTAMLSRVAARIRNVFQQNEDLKAQFHGQQSTITTLRVQNTNLQDQVRAFRARKHSLEYEVHSLRTNKAPLQEKEGASVARADTNAGPINNLNQRRPDGTVSGIKREISEERAPARTPESLDNTRAHAKRRKTAAELNDESFPDLDTREGETSMPIGTSSRTLSSRKPTCIRCRHTNTICDHRSQCRRCARIRKRCVYKPCPAGAACEDVHCINFYPHQWDARMRPRWFLEGFNDDHDSSHGARPRAPRAERAAHT